MRLSGKELWSLVFCGTLAAVLLFTDASAQVKTPLLTRDLRVSGYLTPTSERDLRTLDFLQDAVTFLDRDTLAISYFVKNPHPDLADRKGTSTSAVLFHSAFLNISHDTIEAERSWGNAGYWNCLFALDNGRLFVQANDWVSVYSRDLKQIARRRLIYPSDILPRFAVSPSRRTLYGFQDWGPPGKNWITKIAVIDPVTLEMSQSQTTPMHAVEAASDLQVVFAENTDRMHVQSYPLVSSALKVPSPGSDEAKQIANSGCNSMSFVGNSLLIISGNCPQIILIDKSGVVPYGPGSKLYFAKRKIGGDLEASQNGERLAFVVSSSEKGTAGLEVLVYDFSRQKVIFSTALPNQPRTKFALAIAPDGSRLAVMTDFLVNVWSVP